MSSAGAPYVDASQDRRGKAPPVRPCTAFNAKPTAASAARSGSQFLSISPSSDRLAPRQPALPRRRARHATASAPDSLRHRGRVMVDLYLNFDGVLHPNRVSYSEDSGAQLSVGGHALFEHNQRLVELLRGRDAVHIVLNTWWVYAFGVKSAICRLPRSLWGRVDGSTLRFREAYPEGQVPDRYEATKAMSCQRGRAQVLILDSADACWPVCWLPRCLLLHPLIGLGDVEAMNAFRRLLARIEGACSQSPRFQPPACEGCPVAPGMPEFGLPPSSTREEA
ncbi:HAD domain-containing protein [Ralstonia solanacearum]|uniref:HAD domain-containing protein n=1 Tax=Ralstonia solanacearum TaxID=305 RepID=UPI0034DD461D